MSAIATVASPVARGSSHLLVSRTELKQFFGSIRSRMELAESPLARGLSHPSVNQAELRQFFAVISHRVELAQANQHRLDKRLATGFNVFDFIDPDENKLSDVLAALLDPKGNHCQGDLFLRLLFKQLGLGSNAKLTNGARVQREARTYGILKYRRMDVLVEAGVLLAIENKVDSSEQPEQVKDYLEHLFQCTRDRPNLSTLIYLTPDGRPPESLRPSVLQQQQASGRLHCWSYQRELRAWLENCRRECAAPKIRDFISDFIAYIEVVLKREFASYNEKEDYEK